MCLENNKIRKYYNKCNHSVIDYIKNIITSFDLLGFEKIISPDKRKTKTI